MMKQWPALVMTSGPQAGRFFGIVGEHVSVGRSSEADIHLDDPDVSRDHLRISRQGDDLLVRDTGSRNGTYVNGTRLTGTGVLRPGDLLRVADVELQYVLLGTPTTPGSAPSSLTYDVGDVRGPLNTGDPVNQGGNQIVGAGSIYQGNIHQGDRIDIDSDDGLQELFAGRGPGRVLMAIGLVAAIAGFAIWVSVIFSFMTGMGPEADFASPFDKEIFGLNAAITGFAMFGAGGLLMSIGQGMSKAARRREERRQQ